MSPTPRTLRTPDSGRPSPLQLVLADQVPAQAWRNGGGATRELLVWPTAQAGGLGAFFCREASRLQIGNGAPLLLPPLCLAFDTGAETGADPDARQEPWCWQAEPGPQAEPQPARAWWLAAPR